MKKLILASTLLAATIVSALAQSPPSPALYYGFVPTPAQWNGYFIAKQDVLAYTPVNRAGDTMQGRLVTLTPTTGGAGLNLPPGVAPTSPVNGDVWTTTAGMYVQINGATVGPFGGGGGITALTGDVTGSGSGSVATTLATVNSNVGSFGDATHSASFTVNGKGLITAASGNVIAPPFSAITGSLACSQMPALTGDATTSAGACATAVVKLQGRAVISTAPTDGQVLTWVASNSDWEPNSAPAGNVPVGGTTGQALVKIDATNYNTQWATVAGTGTVTSVGLTGVAGFLTVTGSPITTNGTLALSLGTQAANKVFAGPTSGGATAPTFRSLIGTDLPNPSAVSLGGVESITALSHNWIGYIDTSGVPHQSQPAFTDLSGSLAAGQLPGLASTNLWVGNGGGAATAVAISGDASMSNAGVLTVTKTSGSAFGTFATQNYATPPAIGGTTPASGAFTTLSGSAVTATTLNGNTFTSGSYTLTGTAAKTLNFTNSITLAGTDSTTWTGPGVNATLAALNIADQTVTGGANVTSQSLSTGNVTIDCGSRPLQFITNGGSYTITAPSNDGSCGLLVTNNGSAGATTFTGFSVGSNTGDLLDTTNAHKFMIFVYRINGSSTYAIKALQ